MLNTARPYIDVKLNKEGNPIAILPRDFFSLLETLTAYNNRMQDVKDKALVLDGMGSRKRDFSHWQSFSSLRFATQDEDDDNEPKALLECDPARSGIQRRRWAARGVCSGTWATSSRHFGSSSRSRTARRSMTRKRRAACSRRLCRRTTGLTGRRCASSRAFFPLIPEEKHRAKAPGGWKSTKSQAECLGSSAECRLGVPSP
jgi:hypothetical protein